MPLARPAHAKFQMLTAICSILKFIPWNEVNMSHLYLQSTLSWILLLIVGGTPLVAMHMYAPMSSLETLWRSSDVPSTCTTEIWIKRGKLSTLFIHK